MANFFIQSFQRTSLALAFLSRLGPARTVTIQELSGSVPYFPVAGAILGAVLLLFLWLGHAVFDNVWISAWVGLGASIWLTRGLHWDGWADVWDAWGSNAQGESFWAIMKDSRCGAFAVLGMVFGLLGTVLCLAILLEREAFACIFFAVFLGRCLCLLLAACTGAYAGSSLGIFVTQGSTLHQAVLWCLVAGGMALSFLSLKSCLFLVLAVACFLYCLRSLARKNGGINGDFLGTCIIGGELLALLAGIIG